MREKYAFFAQEYEESLKKQYQKFNLISFLRLVLMLLLIFFVYKSFTHSSVLIYTLGSFATLLGFVALLKIHEKIRFQRKLTQNLLEINQAEANYLNHNQKPWYDGASFINPKHDYSYDLDIFGAESLYHHFNRTATQAGRNALAQAFLTYNTSEEIVKRQIAIDELAKKIAWRQEFQALAQMIADSPENDQKIRAWAAQQHRTVSKKWHYLTYLLPAFFFSNLVLFYVFEIRIVPVYLFFVLNLVVTYACLKQVLKASVAMGRVFETMHFYKRLFRKIEEADFQSEILKKLQQQLKTPTYRASTQVARLGSLLGQLDSINNLFAAIVFNGTLLYHLHIYFSVLRWKQTYAQWLPVWLDTVGAFEALGSMANYACNHPQYVFPKLNQTHLCRFVGLGHPLIGKDGVRNDFGLASKQLVLLTGSNMSGKSTFLRAVGVNLVLAQMGAPVCASQAEVCPIKIITSMRQFDSLSSGESYFFAEIKRLQYIMQQLNRQPCFVLLDEILRGTNSDDKQQGTQRVLAKLIALEAQGILATHDLEVCKMATQYPQLHNFRFEAQIIGDELYFDYKLKSGVCTNKSATFLMEKLGII